MLECKKHVAVLLQRGQDCAAPFLHKKKRLLTLLKKYSSCVLSTQVAFQHFQELDEHISYVATKVCHLGDQLEGVNTPRQRAVEAQRLMTYFNEFLDGELRSDVFNNPDRVSELLLFTSAKRCVYVCGHVCVR